MGVLSLPRFVFGALTFYTPEHAQQYELGVQLYLTGRIALRSFSCDQQE
jgi:hypothetical protein